MWRLDSGRTGESNRMAAVTDLGHFCAQNLSLRPEQLLYKVKVPCEERNSPKLGNEKATRRYHE